MGKGFEIDNWYALIERMEEKEAAANVRPDQIQG